MKKIKSILFILTLLICAAAIPVSVNAEKEGYYTYTVSNEDAEITSVSTSISGDITIPDRLGGYPVTSIGKRAFEYCSLTSITIPDSVTSIGECAFRYCSLTSISIPDGVTSIGKDAFYTCSGLTSVNINSIEAWLNISFANIEANPLCYADEFYLNNILVTDLVIPDSVTSIGNYAFSGYSGLTSITIPDSVTSIGKDAFFGCSGLTSISIPDGVTSIGSYAFSYCWNLANITIPNSVTSIGAAAFDNCTSLQEITLPFIGSSRTANGTSDAVFGFIFGNYNSNGDTIQYYSSSSYARYDIPSSLKKVTITDADIIPYGAFYNCSGLTSITIPDSVTAVGEAAFYNCTSLQEITLPFIGSSRTANGTSDAVFGFIFGAYDSGTTELKTTQYYSSSSYAVYGIPSSLKKVTITDADIIPYGAFYNCSGLTSITISNSVTSIGESAFCNCSGLTSITIPDSVTSVGEAAFYKCTSLTNISIPDSVTSIGEGAFNNCTSLQEMTLPFIGSSRTANSTSDAVFGFVFGGYDSGTTEIETTQYYSSSLSSTYGIPSSLKKVTITDADIIPSGAFYNCNAIDNIIITNADVKAIYPRAFHYCENLLDLTLYAQSPKISNENIFTGCYMLTIHGIEGSKLHTYANNYLIDFAAIGGSEIEPEPLGALAEIIEGKIVITVTTKLSTLSKFMPVALYDENNSMLDLILIPTNEEFNILKVVFKDNPLAHHVKVFLCNSYEDLTPLTDAKEIELVR